MPESLDRPEPITARSLQINWDGLRFQHMTIDDDMGRAQEFDWVCNIVAKALPRMNPATLFQITR